MRNWRVRVEKLKKRLQSTPKICIERASIITDSYVKTEREEPVIRRAKALRDILERMTIYILPEELIVGNQASEPRAAPIFPEYAIDWINKELDHIPKRPADRFLVGKEQRAKLQEILKYWEGKTHKQRIIECLPNSIKAACEKGIIYGEHLLQNGDGHIIVDYEKVLRKGLVGIMHQAEDKLQSLDLSNPHDFKKRPFLLAVLIVCDAAIAFAQRFSHKAREMIKKEDNDHRKKELEEIAKICAFVPANPARTFYEAIQSLWFTHLILQIESNGHSVSLGRFDQYMYPFYKRDIEKNRINRENALELVEHLYIKLCMMNKIRSWSNTQYLVGYPMFQNLTIGGLSVEGDDASNELSCICLEATAELKLPQPSLSARYHLNCPNEYLRRCCEIIKLGMGMPAMFSDEVIIPALLNKGITKEDAFSYAIVGCVEVSVPGKWGYRCNGMSLLNLPKILELTLCDSNDSEVSDKLLLGKKKSNLFSSFIDLKESWRQRLEYYLKLQIIHDGIADSLMERYLPNPFCSALLNDCVNRGKTIKQGGAVYDIVSGVQVGLANVANSLAAVKKIVFDEKRLSLSELQEVLASNFKGEKERSIQQMLIHMAPKYGNDDDYVDILAREVLSDFVNMLSDYRNTRYGRGPIGGNWHPSTSTVTSNVPLGKCVGATPDGRKSGEPLAEGISPAQGTDKIGPTAVIKSASKLPNMMISGGQLLNMKFPAGLLNQENNITKFISLLRTLGLLKVWHIQFNIVSATILRDARRNPDKYRDLLVRVAGYSAFFVELNPAVQEDIIRRTEHKTI